MSSRKRLNKSLPAMPNKERLLTKREAQQNPRMGLTCPPLQKKRVSPLRPHNLILSDQKARILSGDKEAKLNPNYDPNLNKTYFSQMYCVQDMIGEGSFGIVYKVVDRECNRPYAVKISKKLFTDDSAYDDIKLVERLGEHPNIVKFYRAWEEKQRIFMQLELCALSLGTYSKTNHSISDDQLWDILVDMLKAVAYMHGRKLIHLDIKPDNIMMSTDGLYKLGDFGLLFDISTARGSKKCSGSEGDAKYLAREVLEGHVSTAADIFSLGITMLELSTDLLLPVNGNIWQQLRDGSFCDSCFDRMLDDDFNDIAPCRIKEFCEDTPVKLRKVICQMMAGCPIQRPTAEQLLDSDILKGMLKVQAETIRVNYYELWHKENAENISECRPITVSLKNVWSKPAESADQMNGNGQDASPDVCSGSSSAETVTPCVTPPRKVSRVVLYNF